MRTHSVAAIALAAMPLLAVSAAPSVAAEAATHQSARPVVSRLFADGAVHHPRQRQSHPHSPDECILHNGGDYTACNVGNTGGGSLPYTIAQHRTPNECVLLNGGDYNACNVGNSGRGDKPYLHVAAH